MFWTSIIVAANIPGISAIYHCCEANIVIETTQDETMYTAE